MNESLDIDLSSNSRSIIKVGLLIRASLILIFSVSAGLGGLNFISDSLIAGLIFFAISLVLLLVFLKTLGAVFYKEQLLVTRGSLTVIHSSLGNSRKQVFELHDILFLGFANQQYTPHPLDNPVMDVIGVATQEKEMQYVIDEGNIKLETKNKSIKFGKNMPSWDVEEVIEKVENFTGRKFAKPHLQANLESIAVEDDITDGDEPATENESQAELQNEEPGVETTPFSYDCPEGVLVIHQKLDIPSSGDKVFLSGNLAPSAKYQVGDKKFVLVSNGYIYAVRGY